MTLFMKKTEPFFYGKGFCSLLFVGKWYYGLVILMEAIA